MAVNATLDALEVRFLNRIDDPNSDEVPAIDDAGDLMLSWLQNTCDEAAMATDCLQISATIKASHVITVVNYAHASMTAATITITRATAGATVGTEPTQWNAATSNNTTAINIATWLNALAGVAAEASGALVYVYGVSDTVSTITSTANVLGLTIAGATVASESVVVTGMTGLWRIISVVDRTNGYVYRPITRREYQAAYISIVTNGASGEYVCSLFGHKVQPSGTDRRKLYLLPTVAASATITVEYSRTHPVIIYTGSAGDQVDEAQGILKDYETLLIEGMAVQYYQTTGDTEREQIAFQNYMGWLERLHSETGISPMIKPEMSSLYKFIGKTMKELRDM